MLVGVMWGCLFYSIALVFSFAVYRLYSPWYKTIITVICLSWFGHFIGTYVYSLIPSDSLYTFFEEATPHFYGFGTKFVRYITWYVRYFITDDSYLGTLYFFSAFAFIGGVLWYLLFLQCAQRLFIDNQQYHFPAILIMCWPSFLFFTAGIGKDSLTYFLLPLIFIVWNHICYSNQNKSIHFLTMIFSIIFIFMLRPYVLLVLVTAFFIARLNPQKIRISMLWFMALSPLLWYVAVTIVTSAGLQNLDLLSVANHALVQQELQNIGSSFPIFSHDPITVLLLLPYSFVMNLFFPLFLFANNAVGILASFENVYLVFLAVFFWKKRGLYNYLKRQMPSLHFLFLFFVVGMAFMSLINTNLGLSTRHKSMYLPIFLVLAMLVWLKNKRHKAAA